MALSSLELVFKTASAFYYLCSGGVANGETPEGERVEADFDPSPIVNKGVILELMFDTDVEAVAGKFVKFIPHDFRDRKHLGGFDELGDPLPKPDSCYPDVQTLAPCWIQATMGFIARNFTR